MQKNSKEDMTVRYRMHSTNQDNRHIARPHTMSSVSPYSSSNSLNSSDSLGMMNQRLNNSNIPAAHNRKKRVAPRPPSQILESPEIQCTGSQTSHTDAISEVGLERSNLARQNFYVSSPNLAVNNNVMQRSISSNDTITDSTISGSFERRQSENTNRKTASNRPLSIQHSKTTSENQQIERTNSTCSQNHSRTSSESSDITRYSHLPEPQPRKRPPIGKQLKISFLQNTEFTHDILNYIFKVKRKHQPHHQEPFQLYQTVYRSQLQETYYKSSVKKK